MPRGIMAAPSRPRLLWLAVTAAGLAVLGLVIVVTLLVAVNLCYAKKFNPRNINHMPAVKFFACLDLKQKS